MHIGFLQAYFSRPSVGGGELHTERLARALTDRGHEVTIFTDKPDTRREGIDDLNVNEYPTPIKINPINELTLAQRAFKDLQACDVVTLTDDSAWRGVDLSIPTVMVFHIVWHGWVDRHQPFTRLLKEKPQALLYRHLEKKICRKTDAIVSISPNIREDIRLIGAFDDKIVDIPNGVDTDRFSPIETAAGEFTVYFQGRLVEMKNPDLLIDALHKSTENWVLEIGGDGPMRDQLENQVAAYGLEDRVTFLGYVAEEKLPVRYAKADVFALPSDYEGMPLTVLEAAAAGTAVLVSPRAATDFVTDEMGITVEPAVAEITDALDNLTRDPDRVASMGNAARRRAKDYSWAKIAEKYEALYEDLTERKS